MTALVHGFVLVKWNEQIGMPENILYALALVAVFFAAYSLSSHFLKSANHWRNLRNIAIANLSFCLLSALLVTLYWSELSSLGLAYFVGEIVLVVILSMYELRLAKLEGPTN